MKNKTTKNNEYFFKIHTFSKGCRIALYTFQLKNWYLDHVKASRFNHLKWFKSSIERITLFKEHIGQFHQKPLLILNDINPELRLTRPRSEEELDRELKINRNSSIFSFKTFYITSSVIHPIDKINLSWQVVYFRAIYYKFLITKNLIKKE